MTVKVQKRDRIEFMAVLNDETGDVHFFFPIDEPDFCAFIIRKNGDLEKGPEYNELIDFYNDHDWAE